MADQSETPRYPLLQEMLAFRGMALQATYTNGDVATLFAVSTRAIQDRVAVGRLTARDLPGRARFLSTDLEEFLRASSRNPKK